MNSTSVHSPVPSRSLTIIVADDCIADQTTIAGWLERQAHAVIVVASGNEAVRVLKERPVDLIVTEVIMPNGDGLELMLEAKRRQPSTRIIAVSAGGRYLPAADCLRVARGLGAHAAFEKPVSCEELLKAVERVIAATTP